MDVSALVRRYFCPSPLRNSKSLTDLLQANVYHAVSPERRHLALKIYKTSILVFKDRDRYVSGEYRFRKGYRYAQWNPMRLYSLI